MLARFAPLLLLLTALYHAAPPVCTVEPAAAVWCEHAAQEEHEHRPAPQARTRYSAFLAGDERKGPPAFRDHRLFQRPPPLVA